MTWWDALDEYLTEREKSQADAPDPWGSVDVGDPSRTDEQIAHLAFDQPDVPRLSGFGLPPLDEGEPGSPTGDGTGNSPGDA
jgi:hypothetical protein